MSLTSIAVRGAGWLSAVRIFLKVFSVLRYFILARFLLPAEFGRAGLAFLTLGFLEITTELGLFQAFIQRKDAEGEYARTIWSTLIVRGIVLAILLFIFSPIVSEFFDADIIYYLRLVSFVLLIKGFVNPNIMLLRKHGEYFKEFLFQALPSMIESIAVIALIFWVKDASVLIFGSIIGALIMVVLSFVLSPFPEYPASLYKLKELYSYGKWVTLGSIVTYLNDRSDDIAVGKLLGTKDFGLYEMSYKISNTPATEGAGLIYQIVFPLFSKIQQEKERLRRGVHKTLLISLVTSIVFAIVIHLLLPLFIFVVLTPEWLPIIPLVDLMLLFGVLRANISVGTAFFDATGRPSTAFVVNSIKLVSLLLLLFPLISKYGVYGAGLSVVIAQAIPVPWFFLKLEKELNA